MKLGYKSILKDRGLAKRNGMKKENILVFKFIEVEIRVLFLR